VEKSNILLLEIESDIYRPILAAEEQDQISDSLGNSDKYHLRCRLRVSPKDISSLVSEYDPSIFHFNGHGTDKGIVFKGAGDKELFCTSQLEALIAQHKSTIKCVILGSCHTENIGKKLAQHVPYVIAMQGEIANEAAICFSKAFYEALSKDLGFAEAYDKGKMQITIEGHIDYENTPLLYINNEPLNEKSRPNMSHLFELHYNDLDYSVSSEISYSVLEILRGLENFIKNSHLVRSLRLLFISNLMLSKNEDVAILNEWAYDEKQDPNKTIIIKIDHYDQEDLPEGLQDVPVVTFLKEANNNSNLSFESALTDLSSTIEQLSTEDNKKYIGKVYLARSSKTLNMDREGIRRFLLENNYQVLPFNNDLPIPSVSITNKIKKDMQGCRYYIQLLDQDPINGLAVEQALVAKELDIEKYLWRSSKLSFPSIEEDPSEHNKLLYRSISTTYNKFLHELEMSFEKINNDNFIDEESTGYDIKNKFVYINSSPIDQILALKVAKYLRKRNKTFGVLLNRFGKNDAPNILQEQQEKKMKRCDYMIIVQCKTPGKSIDDLIELADDLFYVKQVRDNPIETWVCQSDKADDICINLPGMEFIKCKDKYDKDCVKTFIKMLNGTSHG